MKLHKIKILLIFSMGFIFHTNLAQANCKDPELRQKVAQTAKVEGVNENELLSIIAHESRCHYYTIAWNLPGKVYTAKSKFFDSLNEAKSLAEELIATKQYRVDVGIGQINNEAHIQPKRWNLEEVLNPETALNRVAQVLKERGWAHYHSSNLDLAKRWQDLALKALSEINLNSEISSLKKKTNIENISTASLNKKRSESKLIVYNSLDQSVSKDFKNSFTLNPAKVNSFVTYTQF